jgi:hypothetical protein
MRQGLDQQLIATKLVIAFESGPVSLRIARGMTFADVSESVESFAKWHKAPPLSVDVHFDAPNTNGRARTPAQYRLVARRSATCADRVMASRFGQRSIRMLN